MDKATIDARAKELLDAKDAYYNTATPIMSDAEFDRKLRELREWDPENPVLTVIGTQNVSGQKVDLKYQMFSTEKTLEVSDMDKYWRRINPVASSTDEIVESQKIDGLSLNLTYVLGKLVQATTSGDGFVGSDKTAKTKMMKKIPQELPEQWSGQISGEAHLTDSSFAELNQILAEEGADLQKTSRNSAAGLINSENLSQAEKKLALMDFRVWGVYEEGKSDMFGSYAKYSDQLEKARALGFIPVAYTIISKATFDGDKALEWLTTFDFECDGLVYRLNDNEKARELGTADDYINAATALKPIPEGALTTVTKITWQMGSKELSPVVWYEPVVLGGATCEKASGHSVKNLIDLEAYPGQQIFVTRQGGVIPKVNHRSKAANYS